MTIDRNTVERYEFAETLRRAADDVYAVNEANGWFESERTVGEDIALLHSEVSEMLEAFREFGLKDITGHTLTLKHQGDGLAQVTPPKPEGFGSECADVLIRLLDTCKRRGIDLGFEFERKLQHNAGRGHRHGGKRL